MQLYADCPHCYSVAAVNAVWKNGKEVNGYIPIYGAFSENARQTKIVRGVDLLKKFHSVKSFTFADRFFKLGGHVIFPAESIIDIPRDSLRQIAFACWADIFGAGSLPQMPMAMLNKYDTMELVGSKVRTESCSDYIYLNYNDRITDSVLQEIIKLSPYNERWETHQFDESFFSLLRYGADKRRSRNGQATSDYSLDTLHMLITAAVDDYSLKADLFEQQRMPAFGSYFDRVKRFTRGKVIFLNALDKYITGNDISELVAFCQVNNDSTVSIVYEICQSSQEQGIKRTTQRVLRTIWGWVYEPYDTIYNHSLNDSNVLLYEHAFD